MIFVFWISLGIIVYCYFGYPLILWLLSRLWARPVAKRNIELPVSIVFSAWNEEDVIGAKIQNLLTLDYPANKVEILIGSDGSTDDTNTIIERFKDPRVRFFKHESRRGKMATINELVAAARNPVVIFTDARQHFAENTIRELVKNFADPKVGCVSGELIFRPKEGHAAQGISLYWRYEKFIRVCESRLHSMLGATGAIYAIRRELFQPMPMDIVLDDMWVPFNIIKRGYRSVFDGDAHAFDEVAETAEEEYRRKTRTLFGNYQLFSRMPEMFIPVKSPIAVQLFSHKFLRLIVPFAMIAFFVSNLFLVHHPFFAGIFVLQIIFYFAAFVGSRSVELENPFVRAMKHLCYVPYIFCVLNFSAVVGFWRFFTSSQQVTWQKARSN